MNNRRRKIVHIITGLNTGGAEMMLYNLLSEMDKNYFEAEVISLTDIGPVGEKIKSLNIPVRALNMMRYKIPNPLVILKLAHWLRKSSASVIQTWMYHADLIGSISAWLTGNIPIIWGIHNTNLVPGKSNLSTIWIVKICAKISHFAPKSIICCSEASKKIHSDSGYDKRKMIVIPNGFNLEKFKPDSDARLSVRNELKINDEDTLIGLIARFDPQKDHYNFIQAAAKLHTKLPDVHFLLCGDNIDQNNKILTKWINNLELKEYFHLLGRRDDIPRLAASLDIFSTSSAFGEAFPIVIGEAMACGIPCVATDIGDSALMIGNTGKVVPPKDPEALATAWETIIDLGTKERLFLGKSAREHIQKNFSIEIITKHYESQYIKNSE